MQEIWKDVKNYEGLYEISNLGNVRSLDKIINGANQFGCKYKNRKKGKILKQHINKQGYKKVILVNNNKAKNFQVHRLVAEAFLPNPSNLPQVNHKDENKQNNCVENLEWCNSSYNINYGNRNNLVAKKLKNYVKTKEHCLNISKSKKGKFTEKQKESHKKQNIKVKYNGVIYESLRFAERKTGISRYLIKKYGKII